MLSGGSIELPPIAARTRLKSRRARLGASLIAPNESVREDGQAGALLVMRTLANSVSGQWTAVQPGPV
jgi:hypothetical protein